MKFLPWTTAIILMIFESMVEPASLLKEIITQKDPALVRKAASTNSSSNFVGLVKQYGYPVEEHRVMTEDGYILTFHRIPDSPQSNSTRLNKPIVFLQHGALTSSMVWVILGPENSLAFLLADHGFDVWLGNIRGNTYGQLNIKFSMSDKEFWQFSFHEHAIYDLPPLIDYVLDYTQSKKLTYIGYSMGTTMSYILLSTKPNYNEKLHLVISLAPVAYWIKTSVPPILKFFLTAVMNIKPILEGEGIYGIVPQSNLLSLSTMLCSDKSNLQYLCFALLFSIFGNDPAQLNSTAVKKFSENYPAGGSFQVMYHYAQNYNTEKFQAYDYGYEGNIKRYNQKIPPEYDLKKVSAPVVLIYGRNDALVPTKNILELYKRLPNVPIIEAVPYKYFTHADFLLAIDVTRLINDRIVNLVKQS
ncbi:hypothetical protein KPH14_001768 [Odynerus spinipes]|uniref:Lipase n=1 Tax=Odynerus spinipes TaxID=1348599 RepID=A0AAD9S0D0_9HYME|nr:hypothetical protein KPH14_001768 [Odynerus spinipes]